MNFKNFFGYSNKKLGIFLVLFFVSLFFLAVFLLSSPSPDYPPTVVGKLLLLPFYLWAILIKTAFFYSLQSSIKFFIFILAGLLNLVLLWVFSCMVDSLINKNVEKKTKQLVTIILIILIVLMTVTEATIKENPHNTESVDREKYFNVYNDLYPSINENTAENSMSKTFLPYELNS